MGGCLDLRKSAWCFKEVVLRLIYRDAIPKITGICPNRHTGFLRSV
jgi:hypothetical protein